MCLGESEDIFWSEHGLFWDVDMFGSVMWPYWYALGTVIYCSRGVGMFNRMRVLIGRVICVVWEVEYEDMSVVLLGEYTGG